MPPEERLSKFIEHCGVASRRKAEEIIASGRVSVNNVIVREPQHRIDEDRDAVKVDNVLVRKSGVSLYIALYKPVKYLSDLNFKDDRPLARNLIKIDTYLFPVGRLDYHSEGLMIFTNDGEFANRMAHPRFEVEKEYLVKFKGPLDQNTLKQMKRGVLVDGSLYKVEGISYVKTSLQNSWYKIIVKEGKNRMIRKIGEVLGHPVLKLKRMRIGSIALGDLKPGEYRYLEDHEVKGENSGFSVDTPHRKI
jgi:23S rRNA pseudouridine2605 synthase